MMFDFWKFYRGLFHRKSHFDNYWDNFPQDRAFRFKSITLDLLRKSIDERDAKALSYNLSIIWRDGADRDFTDLLLHLLSQSWHQSEEDIVEILGIIRDPKSVEKLYEIAVNVPDYDEMRALAKKCIWSLWEIRTEDAIEKLVKLSKSDDIIIKENAENRLKGLIS